MVKAALDEVPGDLYAAGRPLPLLLGGKAGARPPGEGIGLVVADVADRLRGIHGSLSRERERHPPAVPLTPVEGRGPAGKLARLLRMLGFDTLYDQNHSGTDLIEISQRDTRIILTRDRQLLKSNAVTHGCWIRDTQPEEQLRDVVSRLDLLSQVKPFARCMACNGTVEVIDKEEVAGRLPGRVRRAYREFRRCPNYGRVYWKGSHYDRMRAIIESLDL